jgi:DNA invertase Pin-like site-specific DNA recombinase
MRDDMAIYGYARVSTQEQVDNTSLAEQIRKIQGLALIRGEDVGQVFIDEGVSGSVQLAKRKAGGELVQALQSGDVVVITQLDRAFRDTVDALTMAETWKAQGVKMIVLALGTDPVNNGSSWSEFFFTLMAAVARLERRRIAERMADGRKSKAEAGGWIGGHVPFGYRKDGDGKSAKLVRDESTYPVLEFMVDMADERKSYRKIAAMVKEEFGMNVTHTLVHRAVVSYGGQ